MAMRSTRLATGAVLALAVGLVPFTSAAVGAVGGCSGLTPTITGTGTINGTAADDVILGSAQADIINGRGGEDHICGGGGADNIDGASGNDVIDGGDSSDTLKGGADIDTVLGGDGNDSILGGDGDDLLGGGGETDFVAGNGGADRMLGGVGDDQLVGGSGNDNVKGGAGEDLLLGGGGDDSLEGGAAADQLRGGGAADRLFGDGGDDTLQGGPGDDQLNGGPAFDVCDGGAGVDTTNQCEQVAEDGVVRVTLSWANQVDMDLHVTEPDGNEIFYGNPVSPSGGELDVDVQCRGNGGIENVRWDGSTDTPQDGTYTVGVDEFNQCGDGPAAWLVEAFVDGRKVLSRSGTGDGPDNLTFNVDPI